jgi:hypothetical protein
MCTHHQPYFEQQLPDRLPKHVHPFSPPHVESGLTLFLVGETVGNLPEVGECLDLQSPNWLWHPIPQCASEDPLREGLVDTV